MKIVRTRSSYIAKTRDAYAWRVHLQKLEKDITYLEVVLLNKETNRCWKGSIPVEVFKGCNAPTFGIACHQDGTPKVYNRSMKTRYGSFFAEVKSLEPIAKSDEERIRIDLPASCYRDLVHVLNRVIDETSDPTLHGRALAVKEALV